MIIRRHSYFAQPLGQKDLNIYYNSNYIKQTNNENQMIKKVRKNKQCLQTTNTTQEQFINLKTQYKIQIQHLNEIIQSQNKIIVQKDVEIYNLKCYIEEIQLQLQESYQQKFNYNKLNIINSQSANFNKNNSIIYQITERPQLQNKVKLQYPFENLQKILQNTQSIISQMVNLILPQKGSKLSIIFPQTQLINSYELYRKFSPKNQSKCLQKSGSKKSFDNYIHESPTHTFFSQSEDTQLFIYRTIAQHQLIKQSIQKLQQENLSQINQLKKYYEKLILSYQSQIYFHKEKNKQLENLIVTLKKAENRNQQTRNQTRLQSEQSIEIDTKQQI